MKNNHIDHLEDLVFKGQAGVTAALEILRDLYKQVTGSPEWDSLNISLKWDGAPSIICGKHPQTGKFFIATKHQALSETNRVLMTSIEEIVRTLGHNDPLCRTMVYAFVSLRQIPFNNIVQGDILFTPDIKKGVMHNNQKYWIFQPNTITYGIPTYSQMGAKVGNASVGVAFHTTYDNEWNGRHGAELPYRYVPDVFVPSFYGFNEDFWSPGFNGDWRDDFNYQMAIAQTPYKHVVTDSDDQWSFAYLYKRYYNACVRAGNVSVNNVISGLHFFLNQRFHAKMETLKKDETRAKYQAKLDEIVQFIEENEASIANFILQQNVLASLKSILLSHISFKSEVEALRRSGDVLEAWKHEGIVVEHAIGLVKLVDRLEFSRSNFATLRIS